MRAVPHRSRVAGMASVWLAVGFLAIAALAAGIPPLLENPGPRADRGTFTLHITRALAVNRRRRPVYSHLTHCLSLALSDRLIDAEQETLIVARYFDWRALPFNRQGIGIIRDDFAPMIPRRPARALPERRSQTPARDMQRLEARLASFDRLTQGELAKDDYNAIASGACGISRGIVAIEQRTGSNLTMTRHLVDELGYAASHAARYQQQSGGRTDDLERQFLWALLWPIQMGPAADRQAQASQALGAGILVNDLPDIPFCHP